MAGRIVSLREARRLQKLNGGGKGGGSGDSVELLPGYPMRADGLWREPRDGSPYRLCNRFEVVAETRPPGGGDSGILLEWQDDEGNQFRYVVLRRLLVGDGREVLQRMAACRLMPSNLPHARLALLEFLSQVPAPSRVRTVQRTGWYWPPNGNPCFVLPHHSFGEVGDERVMLDLDPLPTIYRSAGTLAGWQKEVATRCVRNSRLAFAVSCAFAAPLLELAGHEGGGLNFRGEASSGKTTCLDVAASVWGMPSGNQDSYVHSWRSTANALEATAVAHNSSLLALDELGQTNDAEIGASLYMLANGLGKARARAAGGNRQAVSWRTLVLSTSEVSPVSLAAQAGKALRAGQELRLLDLPAETHSGFRCFDTLHGEANGTAFSVVIRKGAQAHYGHASLAFLAWLATGLRQAPDFVAAKINKPVDAWLARHIPAGADGQVFRAGRRFAIIAVAGELATVAGITGWSTGEASAAAVVMLRDWLRERGGTGSREDQNLVVALRRFLAVYGAARFEAVRDHTEEADGAQVEPPLPEGTRIMQRAGWRWQEVDQAGLRRWVHGMHPDVFALEIARPLGLDERDARLRLGRAGLIRADRSGKETRWTMRVKGISGIDRPRLIVVEPAVLEAE